MTQNTPHKPIAVSLFGKLANKQKAYLYQLTNSHGQKLCLTNYGANITALHVADKKGRFDDLVLGYDTLSEYQADKLCLGSIVGRVAGRISHACFTLDNKTYQLSKNHGKHHIHGGVEGFNHKLWQASVNNTDNSVTFSLISPHKEEGYPGNLNLKVKYTLTEKNEVIIEFSGTSDQATIVNLAQHAYLNLNGHQSKGIDDHLVSIAADYFIPWNDEMIPTGEVLPVKNTPLNFKQAKSLQETLISKDPLIKKAGGIDHYWLFNNLATKSFKKQVTPRAQVYSPKSGRILTVSTDQIGIVLYTGNGIPEATKGKGGYKYFARSGLCLEPQAPTNAINTPQFPCFVLRPNQVYQAKTIFAFSHK